MGSDCKTGEIIFSAKYVDSSKEKEAKIPDIPLASIMPTVEVDDQPKVDEGKKEQLHASEETIKLNHGKEPNKKSEDEAKTIKEPTWEQGLGAAGLKNILKSPIAQKDEPIIVPQIEIQEDVKLKMTVLRGRNLEKQKFGKPDPYVILSYGEQIEKSKIVQGNLNPEWNLEKIFSVTKNSPKEILIEVYDKDKITKDDFMGRTSILISDIPKLSQGSWIPLKDCKNGEILLSGEIIPSTSEIPTAKKTEPKAVKDDGTTIKQIEVATSPAK